MLLSTGLRMGQAEAHVTGAGLSIMHCLAECPGLELRSTPVSRPACAEHWRPLLTMQAGSTAFGSACSTSGRYLETPGCGDSGPACAATSILPLVLLAQRMHATACVSPWTALQPHAPAHLRRSCLR